MIKQYQFFMYDLCNKIHFNQRYRSVYFIYNHIPIGSFKMLGWVNLETQRNAHKCILVFKCVNNLAPPYLSDYSIRNCNVHSYNTRKRNDMHLPKPKLTLGKRTFRYSGALHFNNLPTTIKEATSLPIFKNLLRLYFRE